VKFSLDFFVVPKIFVESGFNFEILLERERERERERETDRETERTTRLPSFCGVQLGDGNA